DYEAGITVTSFNQIIRGPDGEFWRAAAGTTLPYVTTGAGLPEEGAFVSIGDAALRLDLSDGNDPYLGAAIVGYGGSTVKEAIDNLVAGRVSVTPAMFAVDIGSTENQSEKIRGMHEYSNDHGLTVDYAGLGSVYVDADAQIEIKT